MWGEAIKAAGHILNRTPTRALVDKTPFEMWHRYHHDISHLCKLGCKVWIHIPGDNPKIYNCSVKCMLVGYSDSSKAYHYLDGTGAPVEADPRKKHDEWAMINSCHLRELGCKVWIHIPGDNTKIYNRSIECTLVGYSDSSKAYRCLDRSTGRIHISRNAVFSESQDLRACPFHHQNAGPSEEVIPHDSSDNTVGEDTSVFLVPIPHRSVCISNLLGKTTPVAPMTNVHVSDDSAPDTYVHFTFDEKNG